VGLARACVLVGRYELAWETLEGVPAGEDDAEIQLTRGRILYGRTRYAEAQLALDEAAVTLTRQGRDALAFEARHTLFVVAWAQGRYREAGAVSERLARDAERTGRPDHHCSARLASAYFNVVAGDLAASVEQAGQAVEQAREARHPYREADSLILLASAQELVGLYDAAVTSLNEARAVAGRLKTAHHQASIEVCLGRIHLARGERALAAAHLRAAESAARELGDDRILAVALAGEARALCQPGPHQDLDRAAEAAELSATTAANRAPPVEADGRLAMAEVALARGVDAVEHALAALDLMERLDAQERYEIEIFLAAHDALTAAGRREEAAKILGRAWRAFQSRCERIGDAAIRASFGGAVAHNRRLQALWRAAAGQAEGSADEDGS